MSQFGLLLITDAKTVESACRGWRRPLAEPVKKTITNPFTGEPTEVTTYFPEGIDELTGCAPLDEVTETLRAAKPIAIDFQLHSLRRDDFIENAKPFLIGNDELGNDHAQTGPDRMAARRRPTFRRPARSLRRSHPP